MKLFSFTDDGNSLPVTLKNAQFSQIFFNKKKVIDLNLQFSLSSLFRFAEGLEFKKRESSLKIEILPT